MSGQHEEQSDLAAPAAGHNTPPLVWLIILDCVAALSFGGSNGMEDYSTPSRAVLSNGVESSDCRQARTWLERPRRSPEDGFLDPPAPATDHVTAMFGALLTSWTRIARRTVQARIQAAVVDPSDGQRCCLLRYIASSASTSSCPAVHAGLLVTALPSEAVRATCTG